MKSTEQENLDINIRKTYDDISLDQRKKLIGLVNQERWTIKSAAQQVGVKLCTAKYILYQYRKKGKISFKKRDHDTADQRPKTSNQVSPQTKIQYVFVPYPVYIFCPSQQSVAPINLGCKFQE